MCTFTNEKREILSDGRNTSAECSRNKSSSGRRTYKYLGVLEADEMKHEAIKGNIQTEYFTRVRSILKSKLSGGNVTRATNSRAVSIIRYGVGIINWTKEELRKMDRKTRKLLTIHNAMHPQADVDRFYMKGRKAGEV